MVRKLTVHCDPNNPHTEIHIFPHRRWFRKFWGFRAAIVVGVREEGSKPGGVVNTEARGFRTPEEATEAAMTLKAAFDKHEAAQQDQARADRVPMPPTATNAPFNRP